MAIDFAYASTNNIETCRNRLLIVEDKPHVIKKHVKAPANPDLGILTARTGKDGFGIIQHNAVGVVLFGRKMPNMEINIET
jgi:YesN/AraC family two-component response regulator